MLLARYKCIKPWVRTLLWRRDPFQWSSRDYLYLPISGGNLLGGQELKMQSTCYLPLKEASTPGDKPSEGGHSFYYYFCFWQSFIYKPCALVQSQLVCSLEQLGSQSFWESRLARLVISQSLSLGNIWGIPTQFSYHIPITTSPLTFPSN